MLTGNADMSTAVNAVNEGQIFRFLSKPCPVDVMVKSVEAGLRQYRLVTAERQLLEQTLNGSIKVMTEILSLVRPMCFGRASRASRHVRQLAEKLSLRNVWQFEVAAMLSQIGCVTLPGDILEKVYVGQELSAEEQEMFASHPDIASRLLANIPRLEGIASMVAGQQTSTTSTQSESFVSSESDEVIGGQLLKVCIDFDKFLTSGMTPRLAIESFRQHPEIYNPKIVETFASLTVGSSDNKIMRLSVRQLRVKMVIGQDVYSKNNRLLISRGHEVTEAALALLRRWAETSGVREPIHVIAPACEHEIPAPTVLQTA